MLVCFFRVLAENGSGFTFIMKFSKIFVRTSPGAFDVLKVDVLNLVTSPGAFKFYVRFPKMNCAGSSYCQIIG